ncbi:MAG: type I methionyl aminopeptidase [Acholeplasmatales bacterium]|nr:type I methionyl aminopeptidase [Acholeplasmatales bacterium]
MITIKSAREIELLRAAGKIIYDLHQVLKPLIKPGISTLELDQIAEAYILAQGAKPNFKNYNGFPNTICASINDTVIHGIPRKDMILKEGDVISIDMGCILNGYHGDSAWTYGVGEISLKDQELLDVTKEALYQAIRVVKPGAYLGDIGYAIEQFVSPHHMGIVTDFGGHGIGRNLHEDPHVSHKGKKGQGVVLKEGMVICIEPMITLGSGKVKVLKDGWTVKSVEAKTSAHFEHMVAVRASGYDILSDGSSPMQGTNG